VRRGSRESRSRAPGPLGGEWFALVLLGGRALLLSLVLGIRPGLVAGHASLVHPLQIRLAEAPAVGQTALRQQDDIGAWTRAAITPTTPPLQKPSFWAGPEPAWVVSWVRPGARRIGQQLGGPAPTPLEVP